MEAILALGKVGRGEEEGGSPAGIILDWLVGDEPPPEARMQGDLHLVRSVSTAWRQWAIAWWNGD